MIDIQYEDNSKNVTGMPTKMICSHDSECNLTGGYTFYKATSFVKGEECEIQYFEMDECKHKCLMFCVDKVVLKAQNEFTVLQKRYSELFGSGDVTGVGRTLKKLQAKQIEIKSKVSALGQKIVIEEEMTPENGWFVPSQFMVNNKG